MKQYYNALLKTCLFCLSVFVISTNQINAQEDSLGDEQEVRAAIEDYVTALYKVEPERIERSVDTSLRKIGYYKYDGKYVDNSSMSYQQLYDLAGKWNKKGDNANDESPRAIEIYEVHDKTASAKLTAEWGIDFFHLYKTDGKWKIMNVMWQSATSKVIH